MAPSILNLITDLVLEKYVAKEILDLKYGMELKERIEEINKQIIAINYRIFNDSESSYYISNSLHRNTSKSEDFEGTLIIESNYGTVNTRDFTYNSVPERYTLIDSNYDITEITDGDEGISYWIDEAMDVFNGLPALNQRRLRERLNNTR